MNERRRDAAAGPAVRAARGSTRGFSLVEMILVLAIISILSALVVPSLAAGRRGADVRNTASDVKELLAFAYSAAVAQRCTVEVNLDAGRRECVVSVRRTTLPWLDRRQEPQARVLKRLTWPEGIRVDVLSRGPAPPWQEGQGRGAIVFDGTGEVEDVAIEVSNPQGARRSIETSATAGPVRFKEGRER